MEIGSNLPKTQTRSPPFEFGPRQYTRTLQPFRGPSLAFRPLWSWPMIRTCHLGPRQVPHLGGWRIIETRGGKNPWRCFVWMCCVYICIFLFLVFFFTPFFEISRIFLHRNRIFNLYLWLVRNVATLPCSVQSVIFCSYHPSLFWSTCHVKTSHGGGEQVGKIWMLCKYFLSAIFPDHWELKPNTLSSRVYGAKLKFSKWRYQQPSHPDPFIFRFLWFIWWHIVIWWCVAVMDWNIVFFNRN